MYELVLTLHSWIRWVAIIAGIVATLSVLTSTPRSASADRSDTWGLILMTALDLQMLLGLLLYLALSPTTRAIFQDFGGAMRDPVARFWAVEHIALMIVAVVLGHLGPRARTEGGDTGGAADAADHLLRVGDPADDSGHTVARAARRA